MTGVVKWFSSEKGYGFIAPDDGTRDVFCHHSAIEMEGYRTLSEGEKVEFTLGPGRNGKEQAILVRRLEGERT